MDTKLEKTYKENPKLNECITWFEWKYKDRELTSSDKSSIATILRYNSEEYLFVNLKLHQEQISSHLSSKIYIPSLSAHLHELIFDEEDLSLIHI